MKYETLDADDVELILKGGELNKPTVSDLLAAEQQKSEAEDEADKQQKSKAEDEADEQQKSSAD